MAQLWILSGGDGAGKTTFYENFVKPQGLMFINADIIAKQLLPEHPEEASYEAAKVAMARVEKKIAARESFCYETVFSHVSKLEIIERAKSFGYEVIVVYIDLGDPSENVQRVIARKANGGHGVPAEKIKARILRTRVLVAMALRLGDEGLVFSNSRAEPYVLLARCIGTRTEQIQPKLPSWASALLYQENA